MKQGSVLKISVNRERCQGHNRCKKLAPELIELDDYGVASAAGDGLVPAALEEKARLAEANCPEFAIELAQVPEGAAR